MLSMGAPPNASEPEIAKARQLIQEGPVELLGQDFDESLTAASALSDFHDIEKVRMMIRLNGSCSTDGSILADLWTELGPHHGRQEPL